MSEKEPRMACPICGAETDADEDYCHKCGSSTGGVNSVSAKGSGKETKVYCPQCGMENREGSNFCQKCGASIAVFNAVNSSGMGPLAQAPPEIRGWNWGAFFLHWIWGIGNGVWIALLALIPFPFVGLVMAFVLGAKGSEWAWAAKKWDNVEHFKRVQKNWALAGLIVFLVGVAILTLYVVIVIWAVTTEAMP